MRPFVPPFMETGSEHSPTAVHHFPLKYVHLLDHVRPSLGIDDVAHALEECR